MKVKLTVRSVEAIEPSQKDVIVWDADVPGFGLKVTPAGRRSYFLYYRTREGQQRRPAIGIHGAIKPEAAREMAKRWLSEVAQGQDPSRSRSDDRQAPTVAALCERYLSEHAETHKKASSVQNDRRMIANHIVPMLGSKKAISVNSDDIARLHHRLRATPYEANRVLALASKMFGLCESPWGIRPKGSNPAKNTKRFPEKGRERFLSAAEVARLWTVLNSKEGAQVASPAAISAIKLLIMTGRRLNEILKLEWRWVDLEGKELRLPDTKAGALTVALGEEALTLLTDLKTASGGGRYVINGARADRPLINLQKPWRRLRALAGLDDVRIHDLRHTFASVGARMGMSLPLLGRLLGHSQAATTDRYAHIGQDPVRVAADAIGAELKRMAVAIAE